jgi:benzoate membrane transport protein
MFRALPPFTTWSTAMIAALVGFGGTIPLIVEAMRALGASVEQTGSAVTALCLGIAVGGGVLSYRSRIPIVLAWSTPGAALLAVSMHGSLWPEAVGVFVSAALMMIAVGIVPALGKLAGRIPPSIASAMLVGVLLPFCLELFRLGATHPLLVAMLVSIFIAARRRVPLHALLLVLAAGIALTWIRGDVAPIQPGASIGSLSPVLPSIDVSAIIGLGVPLFLVTLVSQNLPGLAVLRAAGYEPKPGPLFVGTGLATLSVAPFGGHAVNLAAITAALCINREAHPDAAKRWITGMIYAAFYFLLAMFAPALVRLFLALPREVITILTGLALIPALTSAIETMLATQKEDRDAAILTFLATASGLTLYGLGSAFWGLLAGFVTLGAGALLRRR